MRVLVTAASKHGATKEIGAAIGEAITAAGHEVTVAAPEAVGSLEGHDAVVLGSAVYAGHWMKPALEFVDRFGTELADRRVWLFSSGPVGDPPKPEEDPVDVAELVLTTKAQDHRIFAGKIDRSQLGFGERALVAALRAPTGDFRDWAAIEKWSTEISEALT